MPSGEPLVRLRGVTKDYRGLRPLRIAEFDLHARRTLAFVGLDQIMAQVLVDLMTGAILPDSGEVVAFGRSTSLIADPDAWLSTLDQFGLLTDRAVLVERFTVEQNLAIPLSLAVENTPPDVRARVAELAREVGLEAELEQLAGEVSQLAKARIRLARALALGPRVLLAEHPSATLLPDEAAAFARDIFRAVQARGLASLVLTADRTFARSVAREVLTFEPSSGALERQSGWRRWFS